MPIQQEEARAKLSLDTSDLPKAKREIESFGRETHKSFLHATSAARGFKGLMHEVENQGGIMGNALRIAISPVGGLFAVAAGGIALASSALEKFNQRLEATAALNAKGISNPAAILQAITKSSSEIAKGRAAFIAGEQAKGNGPLAGLERVEAALGNVENSPEKTEVQRVLLQKTKRDLLKRGMALDKEVSSADNNAGNPKVAAGLESGKQTAELLRGQISAIEAKRSELTTSASEDEEMSRMNPVKRAYLATQKVLTTGEMPGYAASQLKLLDQYKNQLKQVEERTERLSRVDSENKEVLKGKREELSKVLDAYRDVDRKLQGMPIATAAVPPAIAPTVDQSTGAVIYRPLDSKGGVGYKPLPGAIGYQQPVAKAALTQQQQQANFALDLVVKYLQGGGIPVTGKE